MLEIYNLISIGKQSSKIREKLISTRKKALKNAPNSNNLVKVAFDTRRINQETTYNPRRGLQNYHRSEPYISETMAKKIKAFSKLSSVLDTIKEEYSHEPEWQDSYARVLSSSIHKGLRTLQVDGDFSEMQPSMASLDYLDELMYVRYRLTSDNLLSMSPEDLKIAILSKDEILCNGGSLFTKSVINPQDVSKYSYDKMVDKVISSVDNNRYDDSTIMTKSYDSMVDKMLTSISQLKLTDGLADKLFGGIKASKENKNVERTVTVNIKDTYSDDKVIKEEKE